MCVCISVLLCIVVYDYIFLVQITKYHDDARMDVPYAANIILMNQQNTVVMYSYMCTFSCKLYVVCELFMYA